MLSVVSVSSCAGSVRGGSARDEEARVEAASLDRRRDPVRASRSARRAPAEDPRVRRSTAGHRDAHAHRAGSLVKLADATVERHEVARLRRAPAGRRPPRRALSRRRHGRRAPRTREDRQTASWRSRCRRTSRRPPSRHRARRPVRPERRARLETTGALVPADHENLRAGGAIAKHEHGRSRSRTVVGTHN